MRYNDIAIVIETEAPLTAAAAKAWIELVVELGIDADPDGLRLLAAQAVEQGASAVLAQIACDEDAPIVARLRALGRIAAIL